MKALPLLFLCWLAIGHAIGQIENRVSPVDIATYKYKDAYVKVVYGRPAKKNREIFGQLVPYGQVWRTGANEATEITFTRDVSLKGVLIPAGTYSLFTIPNQNSWTIIFNKDVGQWGAYNYNPKQDAGRWEVPVIKTPEKSVEIFTISFVNKNNMANLSICWDDVCITLPIQFTEPKL